MGQFQHDRKCFKCGSPSHVTHDCEVAGKLCYVCGDPRHLFIGCPKQQNNRDRVAERQNEGVLGSDSTLSNFSMEYPIEIDH